MSPAGVFLSVLPMPTRRRLLAIVVLLVLLSACAMDLRRKPSAQWSTRAALVAVHLYQRTASPLLPSLGIRCRFTPTCSRYADAVLRTHGLPVGGWLAMKRLARCGPWTKKGTIDLPPQH